MSTWSNAKSHTFSAIFRSHNHIFRSEKKWGHMITLLQLSVTKMLAEYVKLSCLSEYIYKEGSLCLYILKYTIACAEAHSLSPRTELQCLAQSSLPQRLLDLYLPWLSPWWHHRRRTHGMLHEKETIGAIFRLCFCWRWHCFSRCLCLLVWTAAYALRGIQAGLSPCLVCLTSWSIAGVHLIYYGTSVNHTNRPSSLESLSEAAAWAPMI